MSKPWGGVGAWALEAERAEAEERELAAAAAAAPPDLFPSLKEAAASSSSSKPQKKKKPTTLSLSEFTSGTRVGPGGPHRRDPASDSSSSKFLTHDELLRLPTGPKERSAEELEGSRGFRSYGYGGGGGGAGPTARRPYGGGFDEEGRRGPPQSRASDLDMPSRADEADNWAAGKKSSSFGQGPGRQDDRYGSLGSGSSSKADEVDSWFSNKKPAVSGPPAPSRYSGFGSGFRESAAGSSDSDRWVRGEGGGGMMMSNVGDRDVRERPRLVLDPPKGETSTEMSKTTRASPFGAARPREEVLAEKGVDWKKKESEIEVKKTSRPTSPHSSRPSSAQSSRPGSSGSQVAGGDGGAKIRAKVNPFGDARPREVLLEEKGRDWRKMDSQLEHGRVDRPETEEEKLLKDEINNLKKALAEKTEGNMNGDSEQITAEKQTDLHEQLSQREKDLDKLARELDDKVRFGQKATGSGAIRIAFPSDRPPSQSGMSEDSKSVDYMDRPRSRGGTGESWGKPSDERRGFQGGRESGFFGNRSMDRSRRDGW